MSDQAGAALLAVADRAQPAFTAAVLSALTDIRSRFPVSHVADLVDQGRVFDIAVLIPWRDLFTMPTFKSNGDPFNGDDLAHTIGEVMVAASDAAGLPAGSFQMINPHAVAAARDHAAAMLTAVRDQTKEAVKAAIVEAMRGNLTPHETARIVANTVGLNVPQSRALARYSTQLAAVNAGEAPRSILRRAGFNYPRTAQGRATAADRYAKKLLRDRADMIARTEIMSAANRGLTLNWQEAAASGLIDATASTRQWVVTFDDLTCEACVPMNGAVAPVDGSFVSNMTGLTLDSFQPSAEVTLQSPPLHPRCRCTMIVNTVPGQATIAAANQADAQRAETDRPEWGDDRGLSTADFAAKLVDEYDGLELEMSDGQSGTVTLSKIVLPKEQRGGGTGTEIMNRIVGWADSRQKTIGLTPDSVYGGNKAKLTSWYKRFDFKPNKGRNADFTTTEAMVRQPRPIRVPTIGDLINTADADARLIEVQTLVDGTFGDGFTVQVTDTAAVPRSSYSEVSFKGDVIDKTGAKVGTIKRRLQQEPDGTWTAHHDEIFLNTAARRRGFGSAFNDHMEQWYRANDVPAIKLTAGFNDGPIVWARAGYDFDFDAYTRFYDGELPPGFQRMAAAVRAEGNDALADRIEDLSTFGTPSYPTPYEIVNAPGGEAGLRAMEEWRGIRWL